jgi:hypothetical protein
VIPAPAGTRRGEARTGTIAASSVLGLFRKAGKALLQPVPKTSRRKQSGEDNQNRIAFVRKYMRRLFRKVKRHIADEWQDDPTGGTDWWTQHQQEQRIADCCHSACHGPDREDLARPHAELLKRKYG